MSDPLASPRAQRLAPPRWLDARLVMGVLLVLVSVVVGARVLSSADRSQLVWAASKDLTVGSQLAEGDLEAVRVRLFDSGVEYLRAQGAPPVGYVLQRGIGAGELLPEQALSRPERDVDLRLVTVPVEAGHYPPTLRAGQRIDLWVTPESSGPDGLGAVGSPPDAGAPDSAAAPGATTSPDSATAPGAATAPDSATAPGATTAPDSAAAPGGTSAAAPPGRSSVSQQVLEQVAVHTGPPRDELSTHGTVPVVLVVRPDQVASVVSATRLGRLDVVRVPREAESAGELVAPVEAG